MKILICNCKMELRSARILLLILILTEINLIQKNLIKHSFIFKNFLYYFSIFISKMLIFLPPPNNLSHYFYHIILH